MTPVYFFTIYLDDILYSTGNTLSETLALVRSTPGVSAQLDATR